MRGGRRSPATISYLLGVAPLLAGCADDAVEAPPRGRLLAPPPQGQGFQLSTGTFPVEPGTDEQDCYFFRVGDLAASSGLPPDEPAYLHRTEIAYNEGSHHMNIFRVRTIKELDPANGAVQRSVNGDAPCSNSKNWVDWPLIANSQNDGYFDWTYPEGVANELDPEEWLMLQTHYVNATTQRTPEGGHVDVNFWTVPEEDVESQMGTLFATKQSIRICHSNPKPTFAGSCQFADQEGTRIIGANGHFHSRGKQFSMYFWDGTSAIPPGPEDAFYLSDRWDEPPMKRSPELEVSVPEHGGVWYECDFEWTPPPANIGCAGLDALDKELFGTPDDQLDCCYTFGNTVDRAEHCNVFLYYYPKADDVKCF